MVTVQQRSITVDEFVRLPDPDNVRRELDEGWVLEEVPAGGGRGRLRAIIAEALSSFAGPRDLGDVRIETGFYLGRGAENGRDIVRTPDVALVTGPREERLVHVIRRPPALAVDVLSRVDRPLAVLKKVHQYLASGVQRTWLIDPDAETVAVIAPPFALRQLALGDTLTSEDAGLPEPGFALPLDTLFARE